MATKHLTPAARRELKFYDREQDLALAAYGLGREEQSDGDSIPLVLYRQLNALWRMYRRLSHQLELLGK